MADATITVTIPKQCDAPGDCPQASETCVENRCGVPGSIGTRRGSAPQCTSSTDCVSQQCANDGSGHQYCVETCDPTAAGCPSGFGCLATGGGGVCWPNADNGGGGVGCSTGGGAGGAACFGIGLAALLARRRRR